MKKLRPEFVAAMAQIVQLSSDKKLSLETIEECCQRGIKRLEEAANDPKNANEYSVLIIVDYDYDGKTLVILDKGFETRYPALTVISKISRVRMRSLLMVEAFPSSSSGSISRMIIGGVMESNCREPIFDMTYFSSRSRSSL